MSMMRGPRIAKASKAPGESVYQLSVAIENWARYDSRLIEQSQDGYTMSGPAVVADTSVTSVI